MTHRSNFISYRIAAITPALLIAVALILSTSSRARSDKFASSRRGESSRSLLASSAASKKPEDTRFKELAGNLALAFEGNRGQADSPVKFLSRGSGCDLLLTSSQAILEFSRNHFA